MNKIRIAKAIVNDRESLILIVVDPNGRKMCMTMAELDDDGTTDVIVTDDGFIVSKDEVGYEDHEEEYKDMFEKQELGETCTISPTSHSCLATNKQILLKDEIKQNKLRITGNRYGRVRLSLSTHYRSFSTIWKSQVSLIYSVRDKVCGKRTIN